MPRVSRGIFLSQNYLTSQLTPIHNKLAYFDHIIYFVGKGLHIFEM